MTKAAIIQKLEKEQCKPTVAHFCVGDTVRVHLRIREGGKERTQIFQGTVIGRKGGGLSETFSVHRIAFGAGMVRTFPLHSPRVDKIEVVQRGRVRRAKLNFLRGSSGKAAKVKGYFGQKRAATQVEPKPAPVKQAEVEQEPTIEKTDG